MDDQSIDNDSFLEEDDLYSAVVNSDEEFDDEDLEDTLDLGLFSKNDMDESPSFDDEEDLPELDSDTLNDPFQDPFEKNC